jgi:hypothetical protein
MASEGKVGVLEKKYTVKQAAELVNVSRETVRRRFHDDPHVGRVGHPEGRFKRSYFKLLIPQSELMRWWDELKKNGR